jgi:hypothetical protein
MGRGLQVEVEMLRERLTEKDDVIRDLRARLDAEAEKRRQAQARLTAPAYRSAPNEAAESVTASNIGGSSRARAFVHNAVVKMRSPRANSALDGKEIHQQPSER